MLVWITVDAGGHPNAGGLPFRGLARPIYDEIRYTQDFLQRSHERRVERNQDLRVRLDQADRSHPAIESTACLVATCDLFITCSRSTKDHWQAGGARSQY